MNSKIKIYKTRITPQRNALVDDIETYLANDCECTYSNNAFQYIKLGLDVQGIKIPAPQSALTHQNIGNYCRIEQDNKIWYFFILNATWKGQTAIELDLSIDSINTFRNDVEWSDKTIIQREHEDRLLQLGPEDNHMFLREIDREHENFMPEKKHEFIGNDYEVEDKTINQNFYLIYRTRSELSPDNIGNPIDCFLTADTPLLYKRGGGSGEDFYFPKEWFSVQDKEVRYINLDDSPEAVIEYTIESSQTNWQSVPLNGTKRVAKIFHEHPETGSPVLAISFCNYVKKGDYYQFINEAMPVVSATFIRVRNVRNIYTSPYSLTAYTDILNLTEKTNVLSGHIADIYVQSISSIDRTDSKIMKIIKLPYAPVNISVNELGEYSFGDNWEYKENMMRLITSLDTEFKNENLTEVPVNELIYHEADNISPKTSKLIERESKLFHSDFYTMKFVYDNFVKDIPLEDVRFLPKLSMLWAPTFVPQIKVDFKPTNTINSKFAFRIAFQDYHAGPRRVKIGLDETTDYQKYLLVTRNNEMPVYSNDYINYIRNGYNYDKKAHSLQMASNLWGTVAGAAGGAAGAAGVGKAIGSAAGIFAGISSAAKGIGSIAGRHYDQLEFENQMTSKLQQLASQSSGVSGSDDVDLLQYYNHNRLQKLTYKVEPHVAELLYDLFFYTGYSHNHKAMPEIDSRYWFNFIQCEPVFKNEELSPFPDYLEDIKLRYRKGVTVYHAHRDVDIHYDWEQEYENWETSIIGG